MPDKKPKAKKKLPHVDSWVKAKLRRASIFWPGKSQALQRVKVDRGQYRCEMCEGIFKAKELEADHKFPVIPLDGKIMRDEDRKRLNFNIYIDRLFIGPEGYNIYCKACHFSKTSAEQQMREFYKKEGKKK